RLENLTEGAVGAEEQAERDAEQCPGEQSGQGFGQGDAGVIDQRTVAEQVEEALEDARRAADPECRPRIEIDHRLPPREDDKEDDEPGDLNFPREPVPIPGMAWLASSLMCCQSICQYSLNLGS